MLSIKQCHYKPLETNTYDEMVSRIYVHTKDNNKRQLYIGLIDIGQNVSTVSVAYHSN